jgi:predicted small lipoprotein YifL
MKKFLLTAVAIIAMLSATACGKPPGKAPIGKGKAPITTRG